MTKALHRPDDLPTGAHVLTQALPASIVKPTPTTTDVSDAGLRAGLRAPKRRRVEATET
jgi:hypothetical protein